MKRYICLLLGFIPVLALAQKTIRDTSTSATWQEVERLISVRNYAQTLPLLTDIKSNAKRLNNRAEWTRAFLAESQLLQINSTDDSTFLKVKDHFERHINQANMPERNVLQNFYARFLHNNTHRYLSQSTDPFIMQDSEGKSKTIDSLFSVSLAQMDALSQEPIRTWSDLFEEQSNLSLTPTLYHFLAHHYLSFLRVSGKADGPRTKRILDRLGQLNTANGYVDASVYAMTYRLDINRWNVDTQLPRIMDIIEGYQSDYNAFLLYQIALAYHENNEPRKALIYIGQALESYPNSPWLVNVKNLHNNIRKAEISIAHAQFAASDQYIPIKVTAKNVDSLYIRIYRTTRDRAVHKAYTVAYDSATSRASVQASLIDEDKVALKAFDDYQPHKTTYKLNPLPFGSYTVLLSNNAAFKDDGLFFDVVKSNITVTDLFISSTWDIETDTYDVYKTLLLNRKTGMPFANKNVHLYEAQDTEELRRIGAFQTAADGTFTYKTDTEKNWHDIDDCILFIPEENQFIDLTDLDNIQQHVHEEDQESEENVLVQTLTDRAIYRPGQSVYFKSILYDGHALSGKVLSKKEVQVFLHDANNQKIDSLTLSTNDFGSANGSFQIPAKTLGGTFRILAVHKKQQVGTHYFRVEEYKRPTFKVTFDVVKDTYSLKDTAFFTGLAETLSGVPLADATLRYKVNFYHPSRRKPIVFVDTTSVTYDRGKFRIKVPLMDTTFTGMTDFTLQYSVEVTNQTGEMQAAAGSYRISSKPWNILLQTDYRAEEKKWKQIHVRTQNQNGQPLQFAGIVNIYKYEEPTTVLTQQDIRYFREADYHLLSAEEYKKYFPNHFDPIVLQKETQKTLIKSYPFDTRDTSLVQLDSSLFTQGRYQVEALSIQQGDTVRSSVDVSLYSAETGKVSQKEFLNVRLDKSQYSVGDAVTLLFQTDVPHARTLLLFSSHGDKKEATKVLDWEDGKAAYSFTLQKEHVAPALFFTALLVVDNKAATVSATVPVMRSDKSLAIKTATFRDKITPGQREKWQFTVLQDDKGAESEVLATMYDAALDAFASNSYPALLQLNYPYYRRIDFYYLMHEFFQQNYSQDLFGKDHWYTPRGNQLSVVRSYGLWNERRYATAGSSWNEAAVVGYGTQRRQSLTASLASVQLQGSVSGVTIRGAATADQASPLYIVDGEIVEDFALNNIDPNTIASIEILKDAAATAIYGSRALYGVIIVETKDGQQKRAQLDVVHARANLEETAFFYPTLYTDAAGNVSFEFDSPEALSTWKLLLFAHGKNLEAGSAAFFTHTQKQLMIRPNLPRYFREGDLVDIKAQVQNLSKSNHLGNVRIDIINPVDNQNISRLLLAENPTKTFQVNAESNSLVQWTLRIPAGYPALQVKVVAATDEFSDGELHELPILPNKVLVTDTEKIVLKAAQNKTYTILSATKDNLRARIQIQTNPILEVLSALDYLKNYPYACSEQTASRWFALKMAQYIQNHYPAVSKYFETLNNEDIKGRVEANSSLSELASEEMPWLRDIKGEREKRKALAQLFGSDIQADIRDLETKLTKGQLANGAFSWFEGGKPNTEISIRILEITGKVLRLDPALVSNTIRQSMQKLAASLDKDSTLFDVKSNALQVLNYLYARQYWDQLFRLDEAIVRKTQQQLIKSPEITARSAAGVAAKAWIVNQLYGDTKQSAEIKNRLVQEVVRDEDKGMYWESNLQRFNATSLHSYMVEAYKRHEPGRLPEITQWIYYSKQANHWRTTWMTVDAIYALLLANDPADFIMENTIKLWVDQKEASTANVVLGQSTKDFTKEELHNSPALSIQNDNNRMVYGTIIHQYFLPTEEINATKNALTVRKQYYVERQGKWVETNEARLGERVRVKLTIINDSPLEYVHLKDARPSGMEPIYQPSGYRWWQGYYFTTKDASTNYFFDHLPKGQRQFEYEMKANISGVFNSGITTVECMYDPAVNARATNVVVTIHAEK